MRRQEHTRREAGPQSQESRVVNEIVRFPKRHPRVQLHARGFGALSEV